MTTTAAAKKTVSAATTQASVKQIEEVVTISKDALESVVKASADAANKVHDKALSMSKEQVQAAVKASNQAIKGYEDLVQFNKDTMDVMVKSSTILVQGVQDLSKSWLGLAQESIQEQMAASKALMGAKTLKEVIDLQSSLAKSQFDKVMAESSKLSESGMKLAEEALAPINGHLSVAVEKFSKLSA